MGFKINFNTSAKAPTPSQSYYDTKARFQSILQDKLNVSKPSASASTAAANSDNDVSASGTVDFNDLTKRSGASATMIDQALEGTNMAGLGQAFVDAEDKYGVNALFLVGLAAHESAYGSSRIAQSKQNLFGFQAYDASPFNSAKTFGTFEDGIDSVAEYLKTSYLTPGGKYYNGASIDAVNKRYATDQNWANAIKKHVQNMTGA
ncbi:glucosaminidase domain-containing protein [Fusibacter paucivorans]|uniref:Glucosaminidase domain-containing protein n=1 Tax=Fusibacter paucivorans TaxID=76009 RepID=A0ABS5PT68_9FIRM|nr:glucosaminidase domain-containing protein [Fusibacter paucivorans]MBS7527569.1 glucosaminidase domain-containing protein [Fusibacter paucivorans]